MPCNTPIEPDWGKLKGPETVTLSVVIDQSSGFIVLRMMLGSIESCYKNTKFCMAGMAGMAGMGCEGWDTCNTSAKGRS